MKRDDEHRMKNWVENLLIPITVTFTKHQLHCTAPRNTTLHHTTPHHATLYVVRVTCYVGAFQLKILVDQDLSVIVAETINDDDVKQRLVPTVFTRA